MKEVGSLIGKTLLIGITLLDNKEALISQLQVYGTIIRIDADGIAIKRENSDVEFVVPLDFENLSKAEPGEYSLRSTGETVLDPDFISSWTVHNANMDELDRYSMSGFSGYEKE